MHRKTAKGLSEIGSRANKLPPRLRSALILVDGRRSDADLRALIQQQPDETLAALAEQGFIEAIPAPTRNAPVPAASLAARPASIDLAARRRDAVRALTDAVGPMAETLAMRIERTKSADELRPLLELARQLIQNTRGLGPATEFAVRFSDLQAPPAAASA